MLILSNELNDYFENKKQIKPVPFYLMLKYYHNRLGTRIKICGVCICCNQYFETNWKQLNHRKYGKLKQICHKCSLKYATNTQQWRQKNSQAQKIAQNRPETKKRMSESVKKSKTPQVIKKHSDASKRMWQNESYRKKVLQNQKKGFENLSQETKFRISCKNRFYSGKYESKFGKIYFNSSWQLAFIIWCENNDNINEMRRCKDVITYKDKQNKMRSYFPDFQIQDNNGVIYIVEIKGRLNLRNVEEKAQASRVYYQNKKQYCLYYEKDLIRMGVIKKRHNAKELCQINKNKITDYFQGQSLKNDKSKEQEN